MGAAAVLLRATWYTGSERRKALQHGADQDPEQIAKMREAGLVVAAHPCATLGRGRARRHHRGPGRDRPKVDRGPRAPSRTFLGYGGFPGDDLHLGQRGRRARHPGRRDGASSDGDIISIDAGAIVDGWHGDAAYTAFVGTGHARSWWSSAG